MNARRIMAGLAVTTLVLGTATLTFARGYQGRMAGAYAGNYGACYYNAGYQDLTPEKRAAVDKLIQDHVAEVTPLREQLQAERPFRQSQCQAGSDQQTFRGSCRTFFQTERYGCEFS